jgi:septum site-determining protein MinD
MRFADLAVVVANPEISSVRDSDRIIGLLDAKTRRAEDGERFEKHLLLTRYDAVRAARGEMMRVDDVLEILAIPLLGIVQESPDVLTASNVGAPVTLHNPASPVSRAYADAARRLMGEAVAMYQPPERRSLIDRLFGRRAAAA